MALDGVENLGDGDFEERGIGLGFALVRCAGRGITEDEGLWRVGAVASGIGGAEDCDGFCAEGDGEMERPRVSPDDALGALEQGH